MRQVRETIAARVAADVAKEIDPDDLISEGCFGLKEAEEFSGLSARQLVRRMEDGSLPYIRENRARRIPRKALKNFLALRLVRRSDLVLVESGVKVRKP